ncbi:MAG: methyltransferase domain-containing protein [Actinomycetota bacterium]|nr:methyltransferase domain-containing protein [Actinomycetota bacterium]
MGRGTRAPDRSLALRQYGRIAGVYDLLARPGMGLRRRLVEEVDLSPGQTVLDVACGTGINFPLIQERIGPTGRIIGVDLSPDMLARARQRVQDQGWSNVRLIEASIEEADIPKEIDAALFSLTHDVMRMEPALEHVWAHLKTGGRVGVLGAKWAPRWAFPINVALWLVSRAYVTTFEGYDRPWSHLEGIAGPLRVRSLMLGGLYIASVTKN